MVGGMTRKKALQVAEMIDQGRYREAYALVAAPLKRGNPEAAALIGALLVGGFLTEGEDDVQDRQGYLDRLEADRLKGIDLLTRASNAGFGIASHNLATATLSFPGSLTAEEAKAKAIDMLKLAKAQCVHFLEIE